MYKKFGPANFLQSQGGGGLVLGGMLKRQNYYGIKKGWSKIWKLAWSWSEQVANQLEMSGKILTPTLSGII